MKLTDNITGKYQSPTIQRLIGGQFVKDIYLGDPISIPRYPAITVNGLRRTSEWLTIESTSETYELDISLYVTAADYKKSYELMLHYVAQIEASLFRSFHPLVKPYGLAQLTSDINYDQRIFTVDDPVYLRCGEIYLESIDHTKSNKIASITGNQITLRFDASTNFAVGDKLIQPRRWIYMTAPAQTRYGTTNKDGTMIKAAVISYVAKEEVRRGTPFLDPLTF